MRYLFDFGILDSHMDPSMDGRNINVVTCTMGLSSATFQIWSCYEHGHALGVRFGQANYYRFEMECPEYHDEGEEEEEVI